MSIFKRLLATFLLAILAGKRTAHAQDESASANTYIDHYSGIAQSLGCGQVVANQFSEDGSGLIGFIPEGQDPTNWSRMVTVDLWFLQAGEDSENDLDDAVVSAKERFLENIESRGRITARKQSERANGSPLLYVEFTSGKAEKLKSGAALFAQDAPGLAAGTQVTVKGMLDDASKANLKQLYAGMSGK